MHRKTTREQNDISIIIGNLPRRLRKKIVEEFGCSQNCSDADVTEYARNAEAAHNVNVGDNAAKDPDGLAKNVEPYGIEPVWEANGKKDAMVDKGCSEQPNLVGEDTVVPGILRFKSTDMPIAVPIGENGSRESKRRPLRQFQQQQQAQEQEQMYDLTSKSESPLLPIERCPLSWFEELNYTYTKDLTLLYEGLASLLQQNAVIENWSTFCVIHAQLQHIFKQLLLQQLKFCCENKVDTFFWKLLFYNVRESLKTQKCKKTLNCTLDLLNGGLRFYSDVHSQLTSKYLTPTQPHKYESMAKVISQKLLIWLGDLSRYKSLLIQNSDLSEAEQYYHRALRLIPTNGKPYNQLAIVAIQTRKQLDAIYFHMRSLMSSNPIDTAKESLLVLFDDIRKKYEEQEVKSSPVHQNIKNYKNVRSSRQEVWIHANGVRSLHPSDISRKKSILIEENQFADISTDELMQRFILLYLYIIGKFYTGVGLEDVQEHQRKLFVQLSVILKRKSANALYSKLLKICALNIFILDYNKYEDRRRAIRYHAFNFSNQFFGSILDACNRMFAVKLAAWNDFEAQSFSDLNNLLQYINVYTNWMSLNTHLWEPLKNEEYAFVNCWKELQRLFCIIDNMQAKYGNDNDYNVVQQALHEDLFMSGFTPIATEIHEMNVNLTEKDSQFFVRVHRISNFQKCFMEHRHKLKISQHPSFLLSVLNNTFKKAREQTDLCNDDDNSENIIVNGLNKSPHGESTNLIGTANSDNDINGQLSQLTKLKYELEKKTNVNRMQSAKLEEILNFVDSKLYIEVQPKYLLPDTNCFIDYLEELEKIARDFKYYTLMIPLTVVKELDGLSKGIKMEIYDRSLKKDRIQHFDEVSTIAKKSLNFITSSKSNVKCVTTKGSIISPSLFGLVKEEYLSNDDKILSTALALAKTLSCANSKDGRCFVQTELVLITTDRNLRVKALSRNLAVSELNDFLHWAKDNDGT